MNHLLYAEEACRKASKENGKFQNLVSILAEEIEKTAKTEKFDTSVDVDTDMYLTVADAAKAALEGKGYEVTYKSFADVITFTISWAKHAHYGF